MAAVKTYLNVPFAQKDAAKALGARWDATQKKWYVPPDKDVALFAQWQTVASAPAAPKVATSSRAQTTGVITVAAAKDFVAYNGDAPPWE
ncbi:MAG: DUF5710 domain-containing protein [Methylovulum sp.]|nr:DUF5710 domain-containing protein [Methylovulum sp.]